MVFYFLTLFPCKIEVISLLSSILTQSALMKEDNKSIHHAAAAARGVVVCRFPGMYGCPGTDCAFLCPT